MSALKRRITTTASHYLWNPIMRLVAGRFAGAPALLETVGRKSGRPRHTPVGDGLRGDQFWVIAEHGTHSDWVRNLMANPRVRVKVRGRWRSGTAHVLRHDDPIARQRGLDRLNAGIVRLVGTELLTIRVDLDRERAGEAPRARRTDAPEAEAPRKRASHPKTARK
jgi:deazaflavin-dependent oxidoreductase (nitroreductase family)